MVTKTPNLGLSKPAGTDLVDVTVLNGNMDTLDKAVISETARRITLSTGAPSGGNNGDIWFQYE